MSNGLIDVEFIAVVVVMGLLMAGRLGSRTGKRGAGNKRNPPPTAPISSPPARPEPRPHQYAPAKASAAPIPATVLRKPRVADDLIGIVGFSNAAFPVLLPTAMSAPGVRARVDALPTPKYFRGGQTNLALGLDQSLSWLEKSRNRIRRLVIISDGEPNAGNERLSMLAERARASRVSICSIFIGEGNAPILQSVSDKTVGGWHSPVGKLTQLADALKRASNGGLGAYRSTRRGIVVIAVDLSSSMSLGLAGDPGVTRIEACCKAINAFLDHHRATYGVRVAA